MRKWTRTALGIVALAAVISVVLISLAVFFGADLSRSRILWGLAHGMVYGVAIGAIAALTMEYAAPIYWKYPVVPRWGLVLLTLLVVAFAGCILAQGVFVVAGFPASRRPFWPAVFWSYRVAALITVIAGVIGTVTESYRERLEKATVELRERELERERLRKLASEAQLASIESRLQPHFLFNTLNSISSLIREDPQKAERLIERLSALLRSSLDTHQAPLVSLQQELKLVEDYLEIQRARFGERLRYRLQMAPGLAGWGVPPFSVQTLVENSVKYAVAPRREGGRIEVSAREESGRAVIEVRDDGPGFEAAALPPGHGLENLHARLVALFGAEAGLDIRPLDAGVAVSFSAPQREPEPVTPA